MNLILLCFVFEFTALQKISVIPPHSLTSTSSLSSSSSLIPVNILKQSTSFPPNFIHSLDSTHMLLIALNCSQYNLTSFAAVHDSFYSHASDYKILNDLIKKQFIHLYSEPILNNLREELIQRYKGYKVPVIKLENLPTLQSQILTSKIFSTTSFPKNQNKYNIKSKSVKRMKRVFWRDINIPPLPDELNNNNNNSSNNSDNSVERFNITQVLDSDYFFN